MLYNGRIRDETAHFLAALCLKSGTWAAGAAPLGTVEAFDTLSVLNQQRGGTGPILLHGHNWDVTGTKPA